MYIIYIMQCPVTCPYKLRIYILTWPAFGDRSCSAAIICAFSMRIRFGKV